MTEYSVSNFERFLSQFALYQIYRFFVLNFKIVKALLKH